MLIYNSRISKHVIQSRYSLQIVKCLNLDCCGSFQTNWLSIIPKRFIPMPAIYEFGEKGMQIVEPSIYFKEQLKFAKQTKFRFASIQERLIANLRSKESETNQNGTSRPPPFDSYCPSMESKLEDCICKVCTYSTFHVGINIFRFE